MHLPLQMDSQLNWTELRDMHCNIFCNYNSLESSYEFPRAETQVVISSILIPLSGLRT